MKKIKDKIFGIVGLFIVVLINFFISDKYIKQSENNPDIIQEDMSKNVPINVAFGTTVTRVSASSNSTTTTPPQRM